MSPGKAAAQSVHAAVGLARTTGCWTYDRCTVLEASDAEWDEAFKAHYPNYFVIDSGETEVEPGTQTALAYWEEEEREDGL